MAVQSSSSLLMERWPNKRLGGVRVEGVAEGFAEGVGRGDGREDERAGEEQEPSRAEVLA